VIFADEVYDKVLYDGVKHTAIGSLSDDVLTLTFNSLSKSYRSCGYRAGWMVVSGDKRAAADYIEGLTMLSNMRLCANVPGPVRHPDRAGRLPEHQRPGRPRAGACAASATWPTS
jgi:alanine-synthesizing transaminase